MSRCIVGIGEALWDCLPQGREKGGAPANFAYHAGKLGFKAIAVSAVGDDRLGVQLKDALHQRGLECIFETVEYPTGTVQVEVDEYGIPSYDIKENVAWDNIPFSSEIEAIARECNVVCFGTLAQRNEVTRETIRKFIGSMPKAEDTFCIFDINLRQHYYTRNIIEESLQMCNIFKINDEELAVLNDMLQYTDMSNAEVCNTILKTYNLKALILTCGTNGSFVFTDDEVSYLETPEVDVADTVGAGDSFTAAFIASILKGNTIREAHREAVRISAYVCTRQGAMPF